MFTHKIAGTFNKANCILEEYFLIIFLLLNSKKHLAVKILQSTFKKHYTVKISQNIYCCQKNHNIPNFFPCVYLYSLKKVMTNEGHIMGL